MSDFRIVDRRSEGSEDEQPQEHCGDGCNGCHTQVPCVNEDDLFRPGMIVESVFTGEQLMVIKAEPDNPVSYVCRTKKLEMVRMFEFELGPSKE